ncbi:unnamed protein product [Pocillopora meandrina]|uniref:Uncharacterized protein n=1 Tax=Pocillopora meandrina TaxID=46732 RepID=A0AAU9XWV4_9CNID|nr:unnamed protein product [Pocillopora meandrina]
MIRKSWTIFQKIYLPDDLVEKKQRRRKRNRTTLELSRQKKILEKKFIVFFSCLMQLFEFCPLCTEPSTSEVSNVVGTLIHVTQKCLSCSYARVWRSQPYIKKIPAGNLLLSAAILYSGSMISQTLRMLKILKVQCFSRQTYHKHQKNYLIPVVIKMWKEEQEKLVERVRNLGGGVVLLGDGRSDSPGHSAKYGAFTVIEQRINKVLDVQLVQVINIPHPFSFIKGIGKKIDALAKQKDCENAGLWRRSIINHLYWMAATATEGNGDMLETMWKSLTNHIQEVHEGHINKTYKTTVLTSVFLMVANVVLLYICFSASKVCEKLTDILLSKSLLKDIRWYHLSTRLLLWRYFTVLI